ncbi:hypothetical protein [uncultured Dokdonia sp.]
MLLQGASGAIRIHCTLCHTFNYLIIITSGYRVLRL